MLRFFFFFVNVANVHSYVMKSYFIEIIKYFFFGFFGSIHLDYLCKSNKQNTEERRIQKKFFKKFIWRNNYHYLTFCIEETTASHGLTHTNSKEIKNTAKISNKQSLEGNKK